MKVFKVKIFFQSKVLPWKPINSRQTRYHHQPPHLQILQKMTLPHHHYRIRLMQTGRLHFQSPGTKETRTCNRLYAKERGIIHRTDGIYSCSHWWRYKNLYKTNLEGLRRNWQKNCSSSPHFIGGCTSRWKGWKWIYIGGQAASKQMGKCQPWAAFKEKISKKIHHCR